MDDPCDAVGKKEHFRLLQRIRCICPTIWCPSVKRELTARALHEATGNAFAGCATCVTAGIDTARLSIGSIEIHSSRLRQEVYP